MSAMTRGSIVAAERLEARWLLASAAPALGAIRWDAWWAGNPYQQNLAPAVYQYRLPFYSAGFGTSNVSVVGDSQAVMDQEIAYAHGSGLSYWAFDWYYPTSFATADNFNYGLRRYLASAHKSDMNFCLLLQGQHVGSASNWSATADTLVNMMKEPTYEKVLGDRPLMYVLNASSLVSTFGSDAAAKAAMDTLRSKALSAGLGSPYIAAMEWSASQGVNAINNDGLDAISSYVSVPAGNVQEYPHSALSAADTNFWNQSAATGKDVIPIVTTGWDNRPRWPNHTNGAQPGPYFTEPTPAEIQKDVTNALNWAHNNAPADKANTIIMYAWNESDEGGWLVPTISEGTARLDAVRTALSQFNPTTKPIAIANRSFESPKTSAWYVVGTNGVDPSFGWSSAAQKGSYLLANSNAAHFTRAADGTQALLLSSAGSVWQDIGATQTNATYTVSFSLLTGKYPGDIRGTLSAQIFDGAKMIASQNFTTPATRDSWQTFKLTANTVSQVSGDLTIRFTSTSGMPWLDNVSIKTSIKTRPHNSSTSVSAPLNNDVKPMKRKMLLDF